MAAGSAGSPCVYNLKNSALLPTIKMDNPQSKEITHDKLRYSCDYS